VALTQFPNSGATVPGGLLYLASHNDNLLANPPLTTNAINTSSGTVTLVGKPGGANYYLTSLSVTDSGVLTLDNSTGPITVWVGPDGGSGTFQLSGASSSVRMSADPTRAVRFYVATTKGVTLAGATELDAGIYNITGGSAVTSLSGSAPIYGQIIGDQLALSGGASLTATPGYFTPNLVGPYRFGNSWQELGGM